MARIISVHGTFAQWDSAPAAEETVGPPPLQWWQPDSAFETDMKELVAGEDGSLTVEAFEWSSANSEKDRRKAAAGLLARVKELEAAGEPYSLVGHSHGGSVISNMLIRAAADNLTLPNMRRWITVGTPFVEMRKEQFLFSRLPLLLKAVYVASLMLLFMFLIATGADIIDGKSPIADRDATIRFLTSLTLTSAPFVVFHLVSAWYQNQRLYFYRPSTIRKARAAFAQKWLPLLHEDDEVVTGLGSLKTVKLDFFQENFAVSGLTLASVFVLPLIYLGLLNSPTAMVWIADVLKTRVYDIKSYETVEPFYKHDRKELRSVRRKLRDARQRMNDPLADREQRTQGQTDVEILKNELKTVKRRVRKTYSNVEKNERALRFKEKFLQRADGTDCLGGKLCRRGRSLRINSRLLFHLVTDEVARVVVDDDLPTDTVSGIVNYIIPILLVPIVFMLLAIGLVKFVQIFAGVISRFASNWLDSLTWAQLRRTALGNDTEAEVAIGAVSKPYWVNESRACLPKDIGDAITAYSNRITADSLSKFRNALSELAFTEPGGSDDNTILKFFTWRELVHASYFEVPEFRKLVAVAIAEQDGFRPTDALSSDAQRAAFAECIAQLKPRATDVPASQWGSAISS